MNIVRTMTDKEKIKAEIERRLDNMYDKLPDASNVGNGSITIEEACITGRYVALESMLNFIDALPKDTTDDGLDEAADKALETFDVAELMCGSYEGWQMIEMFKAGAKWQKER